MFQAQVAHFNFSAGRDEVRRIAVNIAKLPQKPQRSTKKQPDREGCHY